MGRYEITNLGQFITSENQLRYIFIVFVSEITVIIVESLKIWPILCEDILEQAFANLKRKECFLRSVNLADKFSTISFIYWQYLLVFRLFSVAYLLKFLNEEFFFFEIG